METQAAKESLADIEARHEDIMKLENSIRELHEVFVQMAVLVENQVGILILCNILYDNYRFYVLYYIIYSSITIASMYSII